MLATLKNAIAQITANTLKAKFCRVCGRRARPFKAPDEARAAVMSWVSPDKDATLCLSCYFQILVKCILRKEVQSPVSAYRAMVITQPDPTTKLTLVPGVEIRSYLPIPRLWWRFWQWFLLGWVWEDLRKEKENFDERAGD